MEEDNCAVDDPDEVSWLDFFSIEMISSLMNEKHFKDFDAPLEYPQMWIVYLFYFGLKFQLIKVLQTWINGINFNELDFIKSVRKETDNFVFRHFSTISGPFFANYTDIFHKI